MNENYLAHFGILGMKWGIRRYQNRDGSLTSLGRKRLEGNVDYDDNGYVEGAKNRGNARRIITTAVSNDYKNISSALNKSSELTGKLKSINDASSNKKRSKALKELKISEMSDQELRDAVNRMNLEDNFSRLASSRIETGHEKTSDMLKVAGDVLAIGGTVASIALAIHQLKNG